MDSPSNPPPCERCGKPIEGMAATVWDFAYYHGDCYATHAAELWANYEPKGGIGASSHDERVRDGIEQP